MATVTLLVVAVTVASALLSEGAPLNDFIGDFEGLSYNKDELMTSHHRMRRSVHGQRHLDFKFQAFDRSFNFKLYSDNSVLSSDFKLLVNGRVTGDTGLSLHYSGQDVGDPSVVAQGDLSYGVFVGTISTPDQQYHIEPAHHHFKDQPDFHSIIYRSSDVKFDAIRGSSCGLSDKNIFHKVVNDQKVQVEHSSSDANLRISKRQAQSANHNLTRCKLFLRGDARFYEAVTSSTFTIAQRIVQAQNYLINAVAVVNSIFESTVFYDTQSSGIGFEIAVLDILTEDTGVFADEFVGVQKYLKEHSNEDFTEYCASYRFTYRDFSGGVLGLAYVAALGSVGGICAASLNTGIVTLLNFGRRIPDLVTHLTFAHELGHNFGSMHDPRTTACSPGSFGGGNFIMFESASTGGEANNNKFSSCSIAMMSNIITNVAQSGSRSCFIVDPGDCGNGMLDAGEQCDCRFDFDQDTGICNNDSCCIGSTCMFTAGAACSPSVDFCCTSSCQPASDTSLVCRPSSECAQEARCDGSSSTCPTPQYNTGLNGTALACANHTGTCLNGECSGSLCLLLDMVECSCTGTEDACSLCCKDNTADNLCSPVPRESFPDGINVTTTLLPGQYCVTASEVRGYCDFTGKCRAVDNNGALNRLTEFFTSDEFQMVIVWIQNMWWVLVVAVVVLIAIMFATVLICHFTVPKPRYQKDMRQYRQTIRRYRRSEHESRRQQSSKRHREDRPRPSAPPAYPDVYMNPKTESRF